MKKSLAALEVATVATTVVVDAFAYSGCAALAVMEDLFQIITS